MKREVCSGGMVQYSGEPGDGFGLVQVSEKVDAYLRTHPGHAGPLAHIYQAPGLLRAIVDSGEGLYHHEALALFAELGRLQDGQDEQAAMRAAMGGGQEEIDLDPEDDAALDRGWGRVG